MIVYYTYDAWGKCKVTNCTTVPTAAANNPYRYRSYYYDSDLDMYYLQSRYYDANICRFINADAFVSTGQGLLGYNMFAYCGNNPVTRYDPNGNSWLIVGIVVACTIVGGMMGAFSAATTGGDVVESAIESAATAAVSATCGLLIESTVTAVAIATVSGLAIDTATQIITQCIENKEINISEIDYGRVAKVGLQTGISTLVPSFKNVTTDFVDAVGTIIAWSEVSALMTVADVIITNIRNRIKSS